MVYEHRSDCWYKDVCQESICEGCIRYMEMKHLMDESGIPKIRQYPVQLIPSDDDYDSFLLLADIKDNILDYVNSGENLYICSKNTGNGKTSWSIKMMLKYFDSIWAGNGFRNRGLFVHVPTLLLQLKDFQNPVSEDYKQFILNADLVIFDDIAVSGVSQYDYNNLLMFIDNRILNGKCNIFTSNRINRASLENAIGSRLASRIWETSRVVRFVGKDMRHGQFADNQ